MPLIAPVLDLLIGLALRLIIWMVVATAKLVARFVWSAVTNHPGLTFLGLKVAEREGWIDSPYTPFVLAGLGVLAIVRFFTAHPPAQIARQVRQETRKAYEAGTAIRDGGSKARSWVANRFRRKPEPGTPPAPPTAAPDPPAPASAPVPAVPMDGTPASDPPAPTPAPQPTPTERTTDGLGCPLDESGRRFFALRDAGYQGWINQDGHAVDQTGARITTDQITNGETVKERRHHDAEALGTLLDAKNRNEANDHIREQRQARVPGSDPIRFAYCQTCRIEIDDEQGTVCPGCGDEPTHRGIR